jgi:hypothetical protein
MAEILSIVIIVFGVLQIILFFKVWGMTNNVNELRKMYDDRSEKLISAINRVVGEMQKLNSNKVDSRLETKISSQEGKKEERTEKVHKEEIKKELPVIDENSNDFKLHLHKWEVLKKKGFVEQAIKEYMQYTGLEREFAENFINGL